MPELPEVEIARRNLVHWLDGRRVVRAEADDTRVFRGARREDFALLKGRLLSLERRGRMVHRKSFTSALEVFVKRFSS